MTKLLIVTDAWRPQINGVVRSLERLGVELTKIGVEVDFLTPAEFITSRPGAVGLRRVKHSKSVRRGTRGLWAV